MIKEEINMELRARIVLVFFISSLILYLSVEGLNFLPSIGQPNSKLDDVDQLAKDQGSPVLEETKEASRPLLGFISSLDQAKEAPVAVSPATPLLGPVDEAKAALRPVSATTLDETKQVVSPASSLQKAQDQVETEAAPVSSSFLAEAQLSSSVASSPVSDQGKEAPSSPTLLWDGIRGSSFVNEAEAEAVISPVSSSILGLGTETASPVPSPYSGGDQEEMAPTIVKGREAAMPTPSGFFDHDIALAIEARIKQSQTDSQSAIDEAKKLLQDPSIASSETGKCLSKCVDKYTNSLDQLNRAVTDLGVRDVNLLADDFGAVETDITTCQACFTQNMGEDSPFKAMEEATTKAARECLTVMDYAS